MRKDDVRPDLLQEIADSGFPYRDRLIHVFIGGSELHGAQVKDTDDMDIYGVYVEPPDLVLGLESFPHYVWSTAGNDRRNGPNDVDVTLYSLRKWATLACKGNPTALHFLFAPDAQRHPVWTDVATHSDAFLSRLHVKHFLGFADDQLKRMTGARGRGKKGQRPELEAEFGFDIKAAMHALRLLYECRELMTEGTITLPRPERDFLIRVRTGKYSLEKVLQMAQRLFMDCETAAEHSHLPEKIDRKAVSLLIAGCYQRAWGLNAEC